MASMTSRYGRRAAARKAALAFCCVFFMCGAAQAASQRLLVFGDSLTAGSGLLAADGFQARLAAALKAKGVDVVLVDGAVSGDTTAGGRARLDWALGEGALGGGAPGDGADAAIVGLGANDGLRGLDPKAMEANLAAILDALAARKIPVLLTGMLAAPNFGSEYEAAYRAAFARLGARPGLIFDPFFLEGVAGNPALNQPDRIHPNAEGVRRIVARLLPLVERLLAGARK